MASSPASSDLSDPPSVESEELSTAVPSSRPSVDITHLDADNLTRPSKRRKTGQSSLANFDRAPSSQPGDDQDDLDISSDSEGSAPASPTHNEYALRDEAQTRCLWRDCEFGEGANNDDLVSHVQTTHCATAGPKKVKYVCEWGECQRKTSNHPSGYALKAHMRSHTKEKPYYCELPECDKAFTRSDALTKHMRTVHDPDPGRHGGGQGNDPTPPSKKSLKLKLTNGSAASKATPAPADSAQLGPTHDEDGNPVEPSAPSDNIAYIPAHHPLTGQPGFMITYPPDINFSAWESTISADQLMRLLRRQLHWAEQEGKELTKEIEELERLRKEEWTLKELLLEGVLEEELARAERDGLLRKVTGKARRAMEQDAKPGSKLQWTDGTPSWRNHPNGRRAGHAEAGEDTKMEGVDSPGQYEAMDQGTPSPPPTGKSGGFDGENDPYDNYLAQRMAEYEERERLRSLQNTPLKGKEAQKAAEADAIGALVGMSGK